MTKYRKLKRRVNRILLGYFFNSNIEDWSSSNINYYYYIRETINISISRKKSKFDSKNDGYLVYIEVKENLNEIKVYDIKYLIPFGYRLIFCNPIKWIIYLKIIKIRKFFNIQGEYEKLEQAMNNLPIQDVRRMKLKKLK